MTKVCIKGMEEIVGMADAEEMSGTYPVSYINCTDSYFATSIEQLDNKKALTDWLTVSLINFRLYFYSFVLKR